MAHRRPARESRDIQGGGSGRPRGRKSSSPRADFGPGAPRSPRSKTGGGARKRGPRGDEFEFDSEAGLRAAPAAGEVALEPGHLQRLNKYLASHGLGSRRRCDELIESGQVWVDGKPCTELGVRIDPALSHIEVEGVQLKPGGVRPRYFLMNKPSGVVCTSDDREARTRAIDLISDPDKGRIFTVGRLDEETTGLLILTNDGDFAHRIMHPSFGVTKTYMVKLRGRMGDEEVQAVREGVYLAEGRTAGARVIVVQRSVHQTRLEVTLQEGKNREVRRVFANLGHKVVDLRRIRIAHLTDRGLKVGRWRPLTRAEVAELLAVTDPAQRAALEAAGKLPKGPNRRGLRTDRGRTRSSGAAPRAGRGSAAALGQSSSNREDQAESAYWPDWEEASEGPARAVAHPLFADSAGRRADEDDDDGPEVWGDEEEGALPEFTGSAEEPEGGRGRADGRARGRSGAQRRSPAGASEGSRGSRAGSGGARGEPGARGERGERGERPAQRGAAGRSRAAGAERSPRDPEVRGARAGAPGASAGRSSDGRRSPGKRASGERSGPAGARPEREQRGSRTRTPGGRGAGGAKQPLPATKEETPGEKARRELGWQTPKGLRVYDASGTRGQAAEKRTSGPPKHRPRRR
jgi:23S rRNA pseudouridine2605 synthase